MVVVVDLSDCCYRVDTTVHRDHDRCLMFPCNLHPDDGLVTWNDDVIAVVAAVGMSGELRCCTSGDGRCRKRCLGTARNHRCHGKADCRIEMAVAVAVGSDERSLEGVVPVAMVAGTHLEVVAGCEKLVVEVFGVDCRVSPGHCQDRWRCSQCDRWHVGSDHLGERILLERDHCWRFVDGGNVWWVQEA